MQKFRGKTAAEDDAGKVDVKAQGQVGQVEKNSPNTGTGNADDALQKLHMASMFEKIMKLDASGQLKISDHENEGVTRVTDVTEPTDADFRRIYEKILKLQALGQLEISTKDEKRVTDVTHVTGVTKGKSVVKTAPFPLVPPLSQTLTPPLIPQTSTPASKKVRVGLDDLSVAHISMWLAEKHSQGKYTQHDEHQVLEIFKNYCKAKGKKYADYIAAYKNAFEWERCSPKSQNGKPGKQQQSRAALVRGLTNPAGY